MIRNREMNIMTDTQRARIIELRKKDIGYSTIGKMVGLSKDTVKSFCRRNGLGGARANMGKETLGICPQCGEHIIQNLKTKPRRFCSDECRRVWWNSHLDKVHRKALYAIVCANCGITFVAYGNRNRKYCCHPCYIEARFGRNRT